MTKILILLGLAAVVVATLSGCYTQVGVVRNDQDDSQQQYTSDQPADTQAGQGDEYTANGDYTNNDDWCYNHPRVGFSYYYPASYWPSTAFSIAYNDPWFYDSYAWGYSPYAYGYGFGYPFYAYSPYGYYPGYGYGYGYGYGNGYYHGGNHGYAARNPRTFGSTRGRDASVNPGGVTPAGYMDLPSATRHAPSGGNQTRGQNTAGTRSVGSTRSTSTPTTQGSSGRGSTYFPDLNNPAPAATSLPSATSRGSQPASRPASTVQHPATHRGNSNRGSGSSTRSANHGSSQGTPSAPSHQPAPSAPSHPAASPAPSGGGRSSSPAPSGGGRSSGNGGGGGRGGNTRGGGGR